MGDLFNSEADVRAWVRLASEHKARWVEPAGGSTIGLPDCWVPVGQAGITVHTELKLGKVDAFGVLKFKVRPDQRRQMASMVVDRVACGLIIGIEGTSDVVFAAPDQESLMGRIPLVEGRGIGAWVLNDNSLSKFFWSGIGFIFLNVNELWRSLDAQGHTVGIEDKKLSR